MITRKNLVHLRVLKGLLVFNTVYCFIVVMVVAWGVPTAWEISLFISAAVLLISEEKLRARIPPIVSVLVSGDWEDTLQQPIKSYPLTEAERETLVRWAEEAILIPAANAVYRSLDARDTALRSLDTAREEAMAAAQERLQCTTMVDLRRFRIDRDAAMSLNDGATKTLFRVRRSADSALLNYLEKWRILVESEPYGIGILSGKYKGSDPMDALGILSAR